MQLQLIAIKLQYDSPYQKYLNYFDMTTQKKITGYHFVFDKLRAFCSELLKKYYLAAYLDIDPQDLIIKTSLLGKPYLADYFPDVDFNITHSKEYVILAIARNSLVGIDLEYIDSKIEINAIAKEVCSKVEYRLIDNNISNFFKIWTKKEALLKAYGYGFMTKDYKQTSLSLNDYENLISEVLYTSLWSSRFYFSLCLIEQNTLSYDASNSKPD